MQKHYWAETENIGFAVLKVRKIIFRFIYKMLTMVTDVVEAETLETRD